MNELPGLASPQAPANAMWYQMTVEPVYLRADLYSRRTAAETREFLNGVAAECIRHQRWRLLISVHSSRPIFTVEKYGLSEFLDIAARYAEKIALLADSLEIRFAHEYAAMLARLRGINVRTFRDEAAAIEWLKDRRYRRDRRERAGRQESPERRRLPARRRLDRSAGSAGAP